jgi:hypothetical protein
MPLLRGFSAAPGRGLGPRFFPWGGRNMPGGDRVGRVEGQIGFRTRYEVEDEMNIIIVIAYGLVAAAAVAGGILLARPVWLNVRRHERPMVQRATRDRRQRTAPVMWNRRVKARRLEDVAKGFLDGFDKGMGAGTR